MAYHVAMTGEPSGRVVTFWFPHELIDRVDHAAVEAGVTRSAFVKDAVSGRLADQGQSSFGS